MQVLEALKSINGNFRRPGDKAVWQKGWAEIDVAFNGDLSVLKPQYIKDDWCRYNGEYVRMDYWQKDHELRREAFSHIKGDKIIELGCGTGINQALLSETHKQRLIAADWVESSQELISKVAGILQRDIKAVNFDMVTLEGWDDLEIDSNSCVLTVHALEQVAQWRPLFDKLVASKCLCVHLEPFYELYNDADLMDYLAMMYHDKRGYFKGFLPAVESLANEGRADIIKLQKNRFGNKFHDAYSLLVWKSI